MVAPSLLSADFSILRDEIQKVEKCGADWIHIDVMDGHFVPNITIGAPVVKSLRPVTKIPFDVHLMIERPELFVDEFISAGADYLTIHVEATQDPTKILDMIRDRKCKSGISLRPATSIDQILPLLPKVDLILIMTVNPGFGGQSFMHDQTSKIDRVRKELKKIGSEALIEIDGGVNAETARACRDADVLVVGSYIFKNDYKKAIASLKGAKTDGN
ncbi:MAG: ribulose-phosphate 3-epimerase [Bdellovibrionales bacterium]|nr:ribulose-phosphate 3-epimerase [Bdellovibrionales bacterium]